MMRVTLAVLHLIGFGIGLGSIYARARALRRVADASTLRAVFTADNGWALSAALLISTGLWRWLGGIEKPSGYYSHNHIFFTKMGLLGLILMLEVWPMITLMRWRIADRRASLELTQLAGTAKRMARISDLQTLLLIAMLVAAAMMARGFGVPR